MWFDGEYEFLSNFHYTSTYGVKIHYEGMWYDTVENAYQAAKTKDVSVRQHIQSLPPGKSKTYARKNVNKPSNWKVVSLPIMEDLLRQKFAIPELRQKLDAIEGEIVEWTHWHDTFWGICTCDGHKGQGQNELGKLLMKLRDEKNTAIF